MQLPAQNDGFVESLGKEPEKLVIDGPASPSSPSSPGKSAREKPVKVLPCPRCESMNTKFCYYNNYSVNQPRHFCRQCQRYWTAGGTLRNVPVGGGSRKKSRHQRGEPYLQRNSPGSSGSSLAMANPGGQSVLQNVGFQQLLTQDMVGLNFSQLPGYGPPNHYVPFSMDQTQYAPMLSKSAQEDLPSMHALYGTAALNNPSPLSGAYYCPDMGALQGESPGNVGVKAEYWAGSLPQQQQISGSHQGQGLWEQSRHTSGSPRSIVDDEGNANQVPSQTLTKNGRYESSMLLNLGLNTRPPVSNGKPIWDQDVKPGQHTNGSPPHGSSTIEEEGSTPTNGYSTSGYEEGDAVSSMWHDMHDMHDIFQ